MKSNKHNYNFQIRLAGRLISIVYHYDRIYKKCRAYIAKEVAESDFVIETTKKDLIKEAEISTKGITKKDERLVLTMPYLETIAVFRKICEVLPKYNAFAMHGAVISSSGQGYMISAPSGIGKSARTKLWLKEIPDSYVINGDKPFICIDEKAVWAYGSPWCGKEGWNTNTSVPLRAIFLLERVDEEKNENSSIRELTFSEAFPVLFQQTYCPQNAEALHRTLQLLKAMDGKVKFYRFRSDLSAEAIHLAYNTAYPE